MATCTISTCSSAINGTNHFLAARFALSEDSLIQGDICNVCVGRTFQFGWSKLECLEYSKYSRHEAQRGLSALLKCPHKLLQFSLGKRRFAIISDFH